jgi:hypothetical protein
MVPLRPTGSRASRLPTMIAEILFYTEYFHAIRVVILRDKKILHGNRASSFAASPSGDNSKERIAQPALIA